jgi:ferric-dicitrate binding protein FerR (iron transport regulator)
LNPFQVSANAGQMTDIILPDNSKVTLNSGSRITYNTDHKNNQRFVTLEGEALFDIEKNPHMPFIVHTQYFDIEVLGTTFNVMAYESEEILETSLVEGMIKLTLEKEGQLYTFHLEPNQKALYNKKNNNIEIVRTNNYKETAWLKGILVFHSDPFDHIKEQLERKYDVAIHLDFPYSQEDKFTGVFDNKSLDEILHNLQIHYGFRYKIEGRNVNILKN